MLLSAEQWRKDEKVDELARCVIFFFYFSAVQRRTLFFSCRFAALPWSFAKSVSLFSRYRTFEFTEKKEVDKYYPQYYHKIDKVKKRRFYLPLRQELTALF